MRFNTNFDINDTVWFAHKIMGQTEICSGKVVSVYASRRGDEESVAYDINVGDGGISAPTIQLKQHEVFSTPHSVADIMIAQVNALLEDALQLWKK